MSATPDLNNTDEMIRAIGTYLAQQIKKGKPATDEELDAVLDEWLGQMNFEDLTQSRVEGLLKTVTDINLDLLERGQQQSLETLYEYLVPLVIRARIRYENQVDGTSRLDTFVSKCKANLFSSRWTLPSAALLLVLGAAAALLISGFVAGFALVLAFPPTTPLALLGAVLAIDISLVAGIVAAAGAILSAVGVVGGIISHFVCRRHGYNAQSLAENRQQRDESAEQEIKLFALTGVLTKLRSKMKREIAPVEKRPPVRFAPKAGPQGPSKEETIKQRGYSKKHTCWHLFAPKKMPDPNRVQPSYFVRRWFRAA